MQIPLPDGSVETFDMLESPVLAPAVAARHPDIKTYNGQGQTHKNYTIRISLTTLGFNAIIMGIKGDAVYFDKVSTDKTDQLYQSYFARDAERPKATKAFGQLKSTKCGTDETTGSSTKIQRVDKGARPSGTQNNTGTVLRIFRLAMAADGEFTQQAAYGGDVNAAFAGLVGYVNRVNAVYRVELSVQLNLVSDESLVYTNSATDPYTNSDQVIMLDENQANLDTKVGSANYDVGHVLGTTAGSGGGIAARGSVCLDGQKGQGVSGVGDGSFAPVFDDQLVAHEIGHQFNMTHSYNSSIPVCTTRSPDTSVEPGSGATIMSYGFTCNDDTGSDDYEQPAYAPFLTFHSTNYDQAEGYIATLSCYTTAVLLNVPPVVVMPANRIIPKSTPFALTGSALDLNLGDALTYSWEGMNTGTMTPDVTTLANTAQPPFFRSYEPVSTGTRTFPRLSAILDGSNQGRGDKLPSVGIVTTQRLTVRDGVGGLSYGEMTVTIDGNSGPFLETTNLSGVYRQNTPQTITWSVNNTTAPPVSCANVDILLSTDGGQSFTTVLASNTPNDGSQVITLPNVVTTQARIKVASSNNIFFDISNADFTITDALPDLTPTLYARSSTLSGNATFTVVVDVSEINSVSSSGLVTAKITKDAKFSLTMPANATSIGSRPVQNSAWGFSTSDPNYYILTTQQVIGNGSQLSFGLNGTLSPGGTSGTLAISSTLVGGSGGESMATVDNNMDADKIDYFQQ
ncbi:reprolysin-like metallopeptidase [Spirosoma koreense]